MYGFLIFTTNGQPPLGGTKARNGIDCKIQTIGLVGGGGVGRKGERQECGTCHAAHMDATKRGQRSKEEEGK